MKTIDIFSIPHIYFCHIEQCDTYEYTLNPLEKSIEITYVAQGCMEITRDNQTYLAKQGDIVCLIRDREMNVRATEYHSHHTLVIKVDWTYLKDDANGLFLPVLTRFSPQSKSIHAMIDDIIYNFHRYKSSRAKQTAQVMNILCEIDTCNHKVKTLQLPGEVLLAEKAKKYIQKHIYETITQTEVANYLKITPAYLCRVFKKTNGTSLMKYINKTKLESIRNLLQNENIHVYEAALLFGYKDANYVSSLHKKLFGYNITDKPPIEPFS